MFDVSTWLQPLEDLEVSGNVQLDPIGSSQFCSALEMTV